MKILLSQLSEFFGSPLSCDEVCDKLTLGGVEVDGVSPFGAQFEGVVVAEVRKAERHPEAERLQIATVFDGKEELQIVCGAPNCRAGLKTALVKIGGFLTDEKGEKWKIKKGKLRGVESNGMLCSEKELGLSDASEGIFECPNFEVGTSLDQLFADYLLEISLTPNLGHCLSALGLARELSALLQRPYTLPNCNVPEKGPPIDFPVEINAPTLCSRYSARIVRGIKVGPSPSWLTKKLESAGFSSINNVVDMANYVMLELGSPLHVFDLNKLGKEKISIELQKSGSFLGLNGKSYELQEETLVVAQKGRILALAGVLGGLDSAVDETTTDLLIECAHFDSKIVRRMGKALGVRTDSAYRFERGVDPEATLRALDRISFLLTENGACEVDRGRIDVRPHSFVKKTISCRPKRVNAILGTNLSGGEMISILARLEIICLSEGSEAFLFEVPSYRTDLREEIDLIEEVGRVYGLGLIPSLSPRHVSSSIPDAPIYLFEQKVKEALLQEGLQEWITCDLISPSQAKMGSLIPIAVLHPSSIDQSVLRTSLLPGMLQSCRLCNDQGRHDIASFEVGRIHFQEAESYVEHVTAAILLSGLSRPYHWDPKPTPPDFFDLKGITENALSFLGIGEVSFVPSHETHLHPHRQAAVLIGDVQVGMIGELHPRTRLALGLEKRVLVAELNIHDLFAFAQKRAKFTSLPSFPSSQRDWTLTVSEDLPLSELENLVKKHSPTLLTHFFLLDLYKSEQIGKDRKNITLRFVYRDQFKTVEIETVEKVHQRLLSKVIEGLGAKIFA